MLHRFICTLVTFLTISIAANAQLINGKVFDATTGNPIPNASIYLNGSSKGTTSNEQGEFTLNTSETKIPLVISYVGYQSETILDYTNKVLNIKLKPRTNELKEVVIGGGGGMSREEKLKIFITQFIGSTSKDCIITNPDDINLRYKKSTKTLEAESSQPLIIQNKKLGYKITYYLSAFKHTPEEISYEGNYFFEEDTSGLKPADIKKIFKAREKAYFGSRMHFIRSLWANELVKNEFIAWELNNTTVGAINTIQYVNKSDDTLYDLAVTTLGGEKFFSSQKTIIIKYNRDISSIALQPGAKQALIAANGYNGNEIIWAGDMVNQRINVLLPYEFYPTTSDVLKQADDAPAVIKDPAFVRILLKQDSFMKAYKPEKLYLQTDKSNYTVGDTIRLKAYLLNHDYFTLATNSNILYVELDDQDGKPAKRLMLPVPDGLAWCDITLDERYTPSGNYTLRAYTNWMRNFGEDYIYKKAITILPATTNATMVKTTFKPEAGKVQTALQFTTLDGKAMLLKDIELKLMNGKNSLFKNQVSTGIDGIVKFNFDLPQSNNPITLQARDITKGITDAPNLTIPVTINRIENTDLQFMPEGGNLVADIKTKVGFKAVAEDGMGTNITGKIFNSKQQEVALLKTTHAGMGSFEFTPKAGETYTAMVNGTNRSYPLPMVNEAGVVLKVEQSIDDDSLTITSTNRQPKSINSTYYLVAQARGVVCFAKIINMDGNQTQIVKAAKSLFPVGIARFTLININKQPVAERQVFINRHDNLNISVNTDKLKYAIRDSVTLNIDVKDKDGKPVEGFFSLAVTDDSQVRTDSLSNNIINNLLLTSDLKGNIEDPGYYFINTEARQNELDNLMLTQGWVGYDWKEILSTKTKPITYLPEKEFNITGKVTNAFGKGVERSPIVLLSNKPFVAMDTLSGKDGRFQFKNLWPVDTAIFKLQSRNKRNKEFNVVITIDEQTFPEFKPGALIGAPWYVNADTTLLKNNNMVVAEEKAKAAYRGEGTQLQEVNIKAKKVVKRSSNLNGPGEADLVFDEIDMLKAGKKTLENLLHEKIKGFGTGPFTPAKRRYDELVGMDLTIYKIIARDFPHLEGDQVSTVYNLMVRSKMHKPWRYSYKINDQEVRFIIDGVDLDHFYDEREEVVVAMGKVVNVNNNDTKRYQHIQTHLMHFTAEDILGIEVLSSGKYTNKYNSKFEPISDRSGPGSINEAAYIEITTRSKQGPFLLPTIGTYLHKPLAFTLPKQFYKPKYTVTNKMVALGTDMRSTLHWEPNIITNAAGKATVSFFTADKPSSYTVILEGVTPEGELGYKLQKVNQGK